MGAAVRRALAVVAAVAVSLGLAACGGDSSSDKAVVLDGRARVPDAEGVVERVSLKELTLDGDRTYRITRELQSFSSQSLQALPVLQRKGQYVHVGLDGDRVAWIAAIGSVLPGDPPTVYYTGRLKGSKDGRITFVDGTVLTLDAAVEVPTTESEVVAELDPTTHKVRRITLP